MARVKAGDVDLIELSAHSSFEHLVVLRNLATFDGHDTIGAILDQGSERFNGIEVNPSGGALAANPVAALGLVRVAEVALQLMDRAGARQVANATVGLAHGTSGQCLQSNGVAVLRRI